MSIFKSEMIAENIEEEDFEDVLVSSYTNIQGAIKSAEHVKAIFDRKGESVVRLNEVSFPSDGLFTKLNTAVKINSKEMVLVGSYSPELQNAPNKKVAGDPKDTAYKVVYLKLQPESRPQLEREWLHGTDVEVDNYIRYKEMEIFFCHDDFLHIFYKGVKSTLKLIRGKYFSGDTFSNRGKKVFRRGQDLFYPFKYNRSMAGPFIALMKLDLEGLYTKIELNAAKPKVHKNIDVGYGRVEVSVGFTDFILDEDDIFLLYSCGRVRRFHIDEAHVEMGKIDNKLKLHYQCIINAVPRKFLVTAGFSSVQNYMRFNLVNHNQQTVSYCQVPDTVLSKDKYKYFSNYTEQIVWGHFRKFSNASIGLFFRPLNSVNVVAIVKSRIVHVYQRGFFTPEVSAGPNAPQVLRITDPDRNSNWVGVVPFYGEKRYYMFSRSGAVSILTLNL